MIRLATSRRVLSTTTTTSSVRCTSRTLSSLSPQKQQPQEEETAAAGSSEEPPKEHPQSFVKTNFRVGEYDPITGSTRPPWQNRSRIISAEDFANRPPVTFDEEFDSMHDAMVTLTHLTEAERQAMYTQYLNLITEQANATTASSSKKDGGGKTSSGTTSHEYVMNVIAQKHNVSPNRVAAVVQNCHDEEQAAARGDILHHKAEQYVDSKIREHIDNCYRAYGEPNPQTGFIEDPLGVVPGLVNPEHAQRTTVRVDDLWDVEGMLDKVVQRTAEDQQTKLNNRLYIEDVDLNTVESRVNKHCRRLIQQNNQSFSKRFGADTAYGRNPNHGELPLPNNGAPYKSQTEPKRRDRWKFAAKIVDTRSETKQRTRFASMGKRTVRKILEKERGRNIVMEENGRLRPATVVEVAATSLKPERNPLEFIYRGVKQAWMDRQLKGVKGGWGRVPPAPKKKKKEEEEEEEDTKEDVDGESGGEEEEKKEDPTEAEAESSNGSDTNETK